ncbi:hypothetical protein [uncultured Gemmiger sp.]|uniref:hypothetical protein n=1 Tax=uncultured Gemmiger sp. TaxID=1623490 RepID=UPI0025EF95C0|nr:hypothetical protein [uncultured Gemmiger sp.]
MGLFGKSKKEREKEYMNRLDVPLCLKEDFELIIDDVSSILRRPSRSFKLLPPHLSNDVPRTKKP